MTKTAKCATRRFAGRDDDAVVNINIVLPSSDATECKALYDRVREESAKGDANDDAVLSELLSGLFNIVATLESKSHGDA